MAQEYLTKAQIELRIKKLETWIAENPHDPMLGSAKKESVLYSFLLKEQKEWKMKRIRNSVPTQIYQQIGVTL